MQTPRKISQSIAAHNDSERSAASAGGGKEGFALLRNRHTGDGSVTVQRSGVFGVVG